MTHEKEKGAAPFEATPSGTTAPAHHTTTAAEVEARALYNPLTWRCAAEAQQIPEAKTTDPLVGWHQLADQARKGQKLPRGKQRRNARRDAINAKRHQGGGAILDAMLLAAGVAWMYAVCLWIAGQVLQ